MFFLLSEHSVPLMSLTLTKSSEDETFFPTYYDAKQVRAQNAWQRVGAISHLQTEMGFVEDFRYSLYN